jgi:hypothetical protein
MNLFSILFYHPEKGFLWGVNQEGEYDVMTGLWSDDHHPVELITTLLNGEMSLYESYYMQRRIEHMGGHIDLQWMREKYVDMNEERYQEMNEMEEFMKGIVWEWFMKNNRMMILDIPDGEYNHRYMLLDISQIEFVSDINALMSIDLFYGQMIKKMGVKKQMVGWEWKKFNEIRPWKSSDVAKEIKEYLDMGVEGVSY